MNTDQGFHEHIGLGLVLDRGIRDLDEVAVLCKKGYAFGGDGKAIQGIVEMADIDDKASHGDKVAI